MNMKVIALDKLDTQLRSRILAAVTEPVLITEDDHPVLVIRSLLDDETADELIAQHPAFQETIERARQQKSGGAGLEAGGTAPKVQRRERVHQIEPPHFHLDAQLRPLAGAEPPGRACLFLAVGVEYSSN